jgi:hypothetical protein
MPEAGRAMNIGQEVVGMPGQSAQLLRRDWKPVSDQTRADAGYWCLRTHVCCTCPVACFIHDKCK